MTVASRFPRDSSLRRVLPALLVPALLAMALAPLATTEIARGLDLGAPDHLVVSEIVTGGTSASDELIELHNPTAVALPLEGLEVIYVTATGATISRRATWALGAPSVPPGGHVLIANELGIYAPIADATYASGMAATGGSVAIRILGALSAIDAVGWGAAASTWMEGAPATAPAAGSSIERLPGGALGSAQDTDDNGVDFAQRFVPEPQNLGSAPTPDPSAPTPTPLASVTPSPSPTPSLSPAPTPALTGEPTPTAAPAATPIATARAAPDGAQVTIEGVAITASDFHDGGGFLADATGGIAVLVTDGAFARGQRVRVSGELDNRFSQRTLRADGVALVILGTDVDPAPLEVATGAVGEANEGRLVHTGGTIVGSPTTLSSGLAFDVDDGSGATRVVVGTSTGIQLGAWLPGAVVDLVGVAGQRDSTGSGVEGYRVLPRNPDDVIGIAQPSPSPTPTSSPGDPSPSPSAAPEGVTPIGEARQASKDTALRIRGVVTLPTGVVDDRTAVIQDASGAMLLRLLGDAGQLRLGTRVEVNGKRSTLGGMESLRVSTPADSLGTAAEPAAREIRTGDAGEALEAILVVARGAVVESARGFASGTVSFEIDDGSGPLRVSLMSTLRADRTPLTAGAWVEVRGVLGQETTRSKPNEGYRIWPRAATEVRVTAAAGDGNGAASSGGTGPGGVGAAGGGGPAGSLDDLGAVDLAQLRIGATLVMGRWKELGIAGLLWDGTSLVAVHESSKALVARLMREGRQPVALDLGGLSPAGSEPVTGAPLVALGSGTGHTIVLDEPPATPRTTMAGNLPAWVSLVGMLSGESHGVLLVGGERVSVEPRCAEEDRREIGKGAVAITAVAVGDPLRLIVPCGGLRRAPTVATGISSKVVGLPRTSRPTALANSREGAGDLARPVVAGLFVAAAMLLLGAAIWARRHGSNVEDEDVAPAMESPDEPGARLTLVRMPHESGP